MKGFFEIIEKTFIAWKQKPKSYNFRQQVLPAVYPVKKQINRLAELSQVQIR